MQGLGFLIGQNMSMDDLMKLLGNLENAGMSVEVHPVVENGGGEIADTAEKETEDADSGRDRRGAAEKIRWTYPEYQHDQSGRPVWRHDAVSAAGQEEKA